MKPILAFYAFLVCSLWKKNAGIKLKILSIVQNEDPYFTLYLPPNGALEKKYMQSANQKWLLCKFYTFAHAWTMPVHLEEGEKVGLFKVWGLIFFLM